MGFPKHAGTAVTVRGSSQRPAPRAPLQPGWGPGPCAAAAGWGREVTRVRAPCYQLTSAKTPKSQGGRHLTFCPPAPLVAPAPLPHRAAVQCWGHPAGRGWGHRAVLVPPELHQSTSSSSTAPCNPSPSVLEISSCSEGSKLTRFGNQVSGRSLISLLNRGDQLISCLLY